MRRGHTSKRWQALPANDQVEIELTRKLGIDPVVARLLTQRGIVTAEAANDFLNPSLSQLHDPMLMPDAEIACNRLKQALHTREKILVHGDYDGDGVTSAALLTRCLRKLGGQVEVFVPHRKRDGYDMRAPFIEQAKLDDVKLIITTDCGIQRVDEVAQAKQHGIDVIVTDHHTPNADGSLPDAIAVVNPHRHDSRYPFRDLAGVGVAFKLCEALVSCLGHNVDGFYRGYLDLACIGTVTDLMPLVGENRIIVGAGLKALTETKKLGLQALIEVSGYAKKPLDARSIGFGLGPRINSASRVGETQLALDLLLTCDPNEAARMAAALQDLNVERQQLQARILEEALAQVALQDVVEARCLVVSGPGWPGGVIGIVAGKIVDRFHRPCVMIAMDEATGIGRGSARSIPGFSIYDAIHASRAHLLEYGGHAPAAGFSIEADEVAGFAADINQFAVERLSEEDCMPSLQTAMEINPSQMCPGLIEMIASMAPFGIGNPEPLFVSRGVRINGAERMGQDGKHLRLLIAAEGVNSRDQVDAPFWNRGDFADTLQPGSTLDICYKAQINEWNGRRSVQFLIEDIAAPEW